MKTISDHILDILQNSVRANASLIEIMVLEDKSKDLYAVVIRDNGKGMTEDELKGSLQPFFTTRTTRRVGLGLPLLMQNAEQTGGSLQIHSRPGLGTEVRAEFGLSHIDRPALGDIAGVFVLSAIGHSRTEFVYSHITDAGEFTIRTDEIKEALDGVPLKQREIRNGIREMIEHNLVEIRASK